MEHKTEQRERPILDTYCLEPGCQYEGKLAQQGHCYHRLPDETSRYCESVMKHGQDFVDEMQDMRRRGVNGWDDDQTYIAYLEGHAACEWANHQFTLDELIYLRAKVRELSSQGR